jgi:16S rRNA (adenine1518-N6/adenine1519-N6)-dimethyltransferase
MFRLGQHFLTNTAVLRRIARTALEGSLLRVIEIGPGHGELTRCLLHADRRSLITAVEYDERLAARLSETFRNEPRVTIVRGDIRRLLPKLVPAEGSYAVVGNIPYYLTGFLLRMLGDLSHRPARTVLTVQREVAERLAAEPPRMNRFAASVRFWCEPRILARIPRTDFRPSPRVDSAVVVLHARRASAPRDAYFTLTRALFAQPRKTIGGNLRAAFGGAKAATLCKAAHIDPVGRPHDLSTADIQKLSSSFAQTGS